MRANEGHGCVAKICKLIKKGNMLQLNKSKTGKRCVRFFSKNVFLQRLLGLF
jgi:hypothetical protein